MSPGACGTYVGGSAAWLESSVSGIQQCYGIMSADQLFSQCNFDCGYTGCSHVGTDYCDTNAKPFYITSQAENDVIAGLASAVTAPPGTAAAMSTVGLWIGLHPTQQTYTNWAQGHPRHESGYDCATIKSDGKWYSRQCGMDSARCACQIQLGTWPTPPPSPLPPDNPPSPSPPPPRPPPPLAPPPDTTATTIGIAGAAVGALLIALVAVAMVLRARRQKQAAAKRTAEQQAQAAKWEASRPIEVSQPDGGTALAQKEPA